jgi:hypothetical protein
VAATRDGSAGHPTTGPVTAFDLVVWPTGKLLVRQAARHKGDSIAHELRNRTGIRP